MAKNRLQKFRTIDEVQTFLNGGITGSKLAGQRGLGGSPSGVGSGVTGLVGKTLIFTAPANATVTFVRSDGVGGSATSPNTNPDGSILTLSDLKLQIEAAIAGTLVTMFDGALVIREATPSGGVVLKAAGTANALLGFDSANDSVGKFYTPPGQTVPPLVAPCWTWLSCGNDNMWTVSTWE